MPGLWLPANVERVGKQAHKQAERQHQHSIENGEDYTRLKVPDNVSDTFPSVPSAFQKLGHACP
jgi:hypothetical protein